MVTVIETFRTAQASRVAVLRSRDVGGCSEAGSEGERDERVWETRRVFYHSRTLSMLLER